MFLFVAQQLISQRQPPPQPSYALEQYIGSEDGVVDRLLKGEKGTQARGRREELSGELEKLSEKITGS